MTEDNPTNLELLRLAKELAYADYNNRRANIHNEWLVDNERMQRLHRTSVPYPSIPPYPTEGEIILRAQKLIDFLNQPRPDLEKQKLHKEVKQLISDVKQEIGKEPDVEEQQSPPTQNNLIEEPSLAKNVEPMPTEPETTEKPSTMSKIKKRMALNFRGD